MPKTQGNILIVDDDSYILLTAKMFLEQHFSLVHTLNDPNKITTQLHEFDYDVILLDMNFTNGDTSGEDGLRWLSIINEKYVDKSVILITAYGGITIAVKAMKKGSFDFIIKPWQNEKLLTTVQAALSLRREKRKVAILESQREIMDSDLTESFDLIGESTQMKEVLRFIGKVAPTLAEVLILGENGTGKELVARFIHKNSNRSGQGFISVDLGALSESLFESELFGHKKGAFTDAKSDRIGRFEAADGGTLFLDEIGNLSLQMQAKLLTVVQNRQVIPVGSNKLVNIDVRIISATNKNLKEMVKLGTFREDLLYRINTVELELPPLRSRPIDVSLLAEHFLETYKKKYQKEEKIISKEALTKMEKYSWPGNIRELQHALERAIIMCEGSQITSEDLGLYSSDNSQSQPFESYNLDLLEKWAVQNAIKKHNGNISHAAEELGLSRGATYRRMEKYDL